MFVVDTDILLYAVNLDAPEHERAREILSEWCEGSEDWYATWGILYEFLRVATHPGVFPKPLSLGRAWSFVTGLRAAARFGLLVESDRHADVVTDLEERQPGLAGNIMDDLRTVALMREHGVTEIRTRDRAFERFDFLRVVDPL